MSRPRLQVVTADLGGESPGYVVSLHPGTAPDYFQTPLRRSGVSTGALTPSRPPLGDRLSSLNMIVARAQDSPEGNGKVSLRDRIGCYTWTWFTMTMATGGISNVIFSITVPFRCQWLTTVGTIFFLFNIVLFLANSVMITLKFRFVPGSLVASFTHQVESLFIPAFVVSIAIILVNTCQYGIPNTGAWLVTTMEILFWIYMGLSTISSAGMYLILWSTQVFPLHTMTPVWVFPAYPLLLAAPFGSTLISAANAAGSAVNSVAITICALCVQATGFLISFMVMAAFLYRLMTQKLPRDDQRPGVFISIGPSGFTVAGILSIGNQADKIFPPQFLGVEHSPNILKLLAYVTGLGLWGLCIWFFLVSVGSMWKYLRTPGKLYFQMTWFSFVFPNTAMITATVQLGRAFSCRPLEILGCVLAGCIILVWMAVFVSMLRCLWKRQLLWPKERKSEGSEV